MLFIFSPSFVTVQKDIFHQITSKVLSIEHEDKVKTLINFIYLGKLFYTFYIALTTASGFKVWGYSLNPLR